MFHSKSFPTRMFWNFIILLFGNCFFLAGAVYSETETNGLVELGFQTCLPGYSADHTLDVGLGGFGGVGYEFGKTKLFLSIDYIQNRLLKKNNSDGRDEFNEQKFFSIANFGVSLVNPDIHKLVPGLMVGGGLASTRLATGQGYGTFTHSAVLFLGFGVDVYYSKKLNLFLMVRSLRSTDERASGHYIPITFGVKISSH